MYRSISVSERWRWKTGWVRYALFRVSAGPHEGVTSEASTSPAKSSGWAPDPAANTLHSASTSSGRVVSSREMPMERASMRRRFIFRSRGTGHRPVGLGRLHLQPEGVEHPRVLHLDAQPAETPGEANGEPVHAGGDGLEPVGAVPGGVEAGHDRQQRLRGADVARGLLAADVLLARLQRHAERAVTLRVLGHADDAAREEPGELLLHREEGGVRSAVAHGNAEALRVAHRDVRAQLTRRGEHGEREEIGGHRGVRALGVDPVEEGGEVLDQPIGRRVLHQRAEDLGGEVEGAGLRRPPPGCRARRPRVRTTSSVCGWTLSETKNASCPGFASASKRCIASAAAVPSSSSEAFATGNPVRSMTIVWKLSSASRRPWEISGW